MSSAWLKALINSDSLSPEAIGLKVAGFARYIVAF
jgi:hypothetical protein